MAFPVEVLRFRSAPAGNRALSTLDQLAEIPKEDIWLPKQKSGRRTRGLPVR
jgi:hypothetical protein